ncbi:MAG: hypothetical protein WA628_27600 [Terriglobales bacterium]
MDKDECIALLNKFCRQLRRTAAKSVDCIDMLKLGSPADGEVRCLLESFNHALEISKEIERSLATPDIEPMPMPELLIPTEDEERATIENAREALSFTIEPTMGGMASIRRLWKSFHNDAHAAIVRQGGGDYLGTKDNRVWFLDENGSSKTLRIDQLTPEAVRRRVGVKVSPES